MGCQFRVCITVGLEGRGIPVEDVILGLGGLPEGPLAIGRVVCLSRPESPYDGSLALLDECARRTFRELSDKNVNTHALIHQERTSARHSHN